VNDTVSLECAACVPPESGYTGAREGLSLRRVHSCRSPRCVIPSGHLPRRDPSAFSGGLNSGRLSDEYTRGVFHAREKMEGILLSDNMEEGITEGEFEDGFRWKADIVRLEQREEEAARLPFDTFTIALEVSWGEKGT